MLNNFSNEYSERSNDELLALASDRAFLTTEAAAALDAELGRRNLTEVVNSRLSLRFTTIRRRTVFVRRSDQFSWVHLFWAIITIALISFTYLSLPSRYHLKPDWQEAAVNVMFSSVCIAVACSTWWRKIAFWMSLVISSAIHLLVVHASIQRVGNSGRGQGKLNFFLGFVLFYVVSELVGLLQRIFYG